MRAEPPSPTIPERRLTLRQADHVGDDAIKHDELHSVTLDLHSSVAIAELSLRSPCYAASHHMRSVRRSVGDAGILAAVV
jgi:hypothetical protein